MWFQFGNERIVVVSSRDFEVESQFAYVDPFIIVIGFSFFGGGIIGGCEFAFYGVGEDEFSFAYAFIIVGGGLRLLILIAGVLHGCLLFAIVCSVECLVSLFFIHMHNKSPAIYLS